MSHLNNDLYSLIPFALLTIAVIGLWIHRFVWIPALAAALVAACLTHALHPVALVWIGILLALALGFRWARDRPGGGARTWLPAAIGVAFFVFAFAVALLLLPGFPRTTLVAQMRLSADAGVFSVGLGFAKVVTGIFILGIINPVRVASWRELGAVLARAAPVFVITVILVMAFTLAVGYVKPDPKWTTLFLPWAAANLFFTCLSEEAFFRGFVQHELARAGGNTRAAAVAALLVGAVLFGLAHFGGGWLYVTAGVFAGIGYGWAYLRTQRIEAAIAVHFALNAVHFLFFTYPYAVT